MTTLADKTPPPSPQPTLRIDEHQIRGHLDEMVRTTVEQTLNDLLDAEAESLCGAKPYERSESRKALRSGHYEYPIKDTHLSTKSHPQPITAHDSSPVANCFGDWLASTSSTCVRAARRRCVHRSTSRSSQRSTFPA